MVTEFLALFKKNTFSHSPGEMQGHRRVLNVLANLSRKCTFKHAYFWLAGNLNPRKPGKSRKSELVKLQYNPNDYK